MKTDELIRLMAEDTRRTVPLTRRVLVAIAAGGLVSVLLLVATVGPRANLATALGDWRVDLKILATALMAVLALRLAWVAGIPGEPWMRRAVWLVVPLLMIGTGIVADLSLLPPSQWTSAWLGQHAAFCVFFIPVLSLSPLVLLLAALRHGAPDRPGIAGLLAGISAGCMGAAIYAWHCPDDSPLFVTWYLVGISVAAIIGGLAGRRLLVW